MRVIVCGGREYNDRARIFAALDLLHSRRPISVLVHGDARGADRLAGEWARERGVQVEAHPGDWLIYKNMAGPMRNLHMARLGADLVVAFPGGKGTAHMIATAGRHGIRVWQPFKS